MTDAAHSPARSDPAPPAAFAPLRHRLFAVIWAATVLGNVGTFMRDVASAWLVLDLSPSPAAVSLIQAAATLPVFLLAIPAGVLSDIVDRRRLLIGIQCGLACVSTALLVLAWSGIASVASLAALTFLGGVGAALASPSWQSIVPELVPRPMLKGAVALNSLGFNISRAIGPALGGVLLAAFGAAATYAADVASYVVVVAALVWWTRAPPSPDDLPERFTGALRAGLRFARASRELHRVLWVGGLFFVCASAVWALLPLIAGPLLGGGPGFYGMALGGIGAGAVIGAVLLGRVRQRVGAEGVVAGGAVVTAAVLVVLALVPPLWLAVPVLLGLGMAWIAVLTTLSATTQAILPNWVRGRGLALYLTLFNGAMTVGSLAWGMVASAAGVPAALLVAAGGMLVVGLVARRWPLPAGDEDLTPAISWPDPVLAAPLEQAGVHDRGPVLITVEYRIAADDRRAFDATLPRLSQQRRRDGAYAWGIAEDASDPERLLEWFFVESWAEHLRQHRRVSRADADLQAAQRTLHRGASPPVVSHFLAFDPHPPADPPDGRS